MAARAITTPAARLLTLAALGGRGLRSNPLGDSSRRMSGAGSGWGLVFSVTLYLNLSRLFPATEDECRPFEKTIDNIKVFLHPIVDHLLFAVRADYDQHRRLAILDGRVHLDI